MNSVTENSSALGTFDGVTRHLAALAEAGAESAHLLDNSQSLHSLAHTYLKTRISQETGLSVSNPDALFFNREDAQVGRVSRSVMNMMIDVLRGAISLEALEDAEVFLRHDTFDPALRIAVQERRSVIEIVRDAVAQLPDIYIRNLDGFWDQPEPMHEGSARQQLSALHDTTLKNDIALLGLSRQLSEEEQRRLSEVLESRGPVGVFSIDLAVDDSVITLPSAWAVNASAEQSTQPQGEVFLVAVGGGIARFGSLAALREELSRRISDPADALTLLLRSRDQQRLSVHGPVVAHLWAFTPLNAPLIDTFTRAVQAKQRDDSHHLLQHSDAGSDTDSFLRDLERVRVCSDLDEAVGQRFARLSSDLCTLVQPRWRKFAQPDHQVHLTNLEQEHLRRKRDVEAVLTGLESVEGFAAAEMVKYCRERLGLTLDPAAIELTVNDSIGVDGSEPLNAVYQGTLLHFAVNGLPATRDEVQVAPAGLHVDFTSTFIDTMLNELDIPQRYAHALRDRYLDEENLRTMARHRDSALAMSAQAALMQGHLLQDRSHELLIQIRGDVRRPDADHSIGSLHIMGTGARFRDLIVFSEKTAVDEHFVLYAPGAPGGQDFYEFASWRQLSFHVGGWLASESGRSFVHDQLAGPLQHGLNAQLNDIQLKPTLWGPDTCVFEPCPHENYEANLALLVLLKVVAIVKGEKIAVSPLDAPGSLVSRQLLATVEARIGALNAEFAKLSPGLVTLQDYAHKHVSAELNGFLRSQGYERHVDPDTLYFGLGQPYFETPDFGEHTPLRSLTELVMYGTEDILSHRQAIHLYSSTGLDVSQLPRHLIQFADKQVREADLGARYMDFLTEGFLGRKDPRYARRKALMAKRVQHEMIRGAMLQYLEGDLSDPQYSWLRGAIIALGTDQSSNVGNGTTGVSAFRMAGQIVEGVYIFQDFARGEPGYKLLYTPGAPDGVHFRPLTDYGALLGSVSMQSYFYGRVAYAGQRRVGTFIDNFERGGKHDPSFLTIVNRMEDRLRDAGQLYGDMLERMIADVDEEIESLAEKRLSTAWNVIRWTGTILLLPFPVASFAWGTLTSVVTLIKAYDAYASGDKAAALPLLIFGVIGIVTTADGVRAFLQGSLTLLKGIGVRAGVWAWRKLKLDRAYTIPA
ncbi:hypothetical protein N5D61_07570 [Pseudomonas sp. GD03842]|uniref:dermonecrotic toxin domain-containing protein n=1 Tax=Pseudomonas sp. GD03842 TaxID=2975385 RepID=UPI002448BBFC|nr:DUF6543 domain-containing protein [Pseudomonas sp. GD03842]MDH0746197.1 hypothetical protein [Pseudomonas sp. GD03842]